MHADRIVQRLVVLSCLTLLASCTGVREQPPPSPTTPEQDRAAIAALLPGKIPDRAGWAADIESALRIQHVPASRPNVCAVIAVIQQESGFRIDPAIPGLPAMAWHEIDRRASESGIPVVLVHGALRLTSSNGRSFAERLDHARTEKDLSDIYEDFISMVPLGQRLFAERNPVRTRGPMQVNVAFARAYVAHDPYPYRLSGPLSDDLFTRRGSLFFGVAHLLGYNPGSSDFLYRFADYNAGQFASRNAAFQNALNRVAGANLQLDGALLPRDPAAANAGSTGNAARSVAARLGLSEHDIDVALEGERSVEFERTGLYQRVFSLADRQNGRKMPRAVVPHIRLHGPKLSRTLSTDWYAHRVDGRFQRCVGSRP